jgi:hypothetical protein
MQAILQIVAHTPLWVFAVLAVITAVGVQSLRTRTLAFWRLVLVPALFALWGLVTLVLHTIDEPMSAALWAVLAAAGIALAYGTIRLDGVRVVRETGTIEVPGSPAPLIRNLVVFAAKYAISAGIAVSATHRDALYLADLALSGLMSGYFACWMFLIARKCWGQGVLRTA